MKQSKSHLLFLDGIRALSALYVVVHHISLQYYGNPSIIKPKGLTPISIVLMRVYRPTLSSLPLG
jgi:peptidoglycan/LPS O-acetylase OafA/YrhL